MPASDEQCVEMQAAGLDARQAAPRRAGPSAARPLQRAVEERAGRRSAGRRGRRSSTAAARSGARRLVDEVLAGEHAVQRRRTRAQPLGALGRCRRTGTPRRRGPASASATETNTSGVSRCSSSGTTAGSGSSGSRKCGTARKPPTADSTASTTSTPVIDARRLVDVVLDLRRSCASAPKNVSHSSRNM